MLKTVIDYIFYQLCGLDQSVRFIAALNFFVYDTLKILILLFVMISVIGFLRTFLQPDRVKAMIAKAGFSGYLLAAVFGAITPFCSCSSIPLFFGFLKANIPLGVTLAFLITSPIINEYLVVLMAGFFGWRIAGLYVASGIMLGVLAGFSLGKLKLEKYIVQDFIPAKPAFTFKQPVLTAKLRMYFGFSEAIEIIKKIWLWVILGVAVGAVIHNWVPRAAIEAVMTKTGVFAVPLAVLIGVPMYGSCAAIVPIAVALFNKGVPLGTALSFMMAVTALSAPEAVILKRAMKLKLIVIFFSVTTLGIIITGYLFNFITKGL